MALNDGIVHKRRCRVWVQETADHHVISIQPTMELAPSDRVMLRGWMLSDMASSGCFQ